MGVSTKQLQDERTVLQKTFDELNVKIKTVENETQKMRNNLNAVHGAMQEIDKLIKMDMLHGDSTGRKDDENQPSAASLDIKEKEQVRLLQEERAKEGDKEGDK